MAKPRARSHPTISRRSPSVSALGTEAKIPSVMRVAVASLLCVLLVGGCARLPVEPTTADFRIEGKVGVVQQERAFSARFRWLQTGNRFDVAVWGPLGQGRVRLRGDPNRVEIIGQDGKGARLGHPEALMREQLGWSLPLGALRWWIVGRPAPEWPVQSAEVDAVGNLIAFQQFGWQLRFARFEQRGDSAMPMRIDAQRPRTKIRIILNRGPR